MSYVDTPEKKQKHPHYEHRTTKLDRKDNEFSSKKFHRVRKVSTHKKLLKSFGRISMCLNGKTPTSIPIGDLNKVCFILVNDYDDEHNDLGVGPLNDGYLAGLKHHRFGYKVFYLYNSTSEEFSNFLGFFLKNTTDELTVFYSGLEDNGQGIEFNSGSLSKSSIGQVIANNCTGKPRVMFITDCIGGGSVFDISSGSNLISLSVRKTNSPESKESKRSHGIFTYYLFKIFSDCPNITPNRLIERMNPSLQRFNEVFTCEMTDQQFCDSPIFIN
ncbi:hypothetical protein M9Y10_011215 [Tritrichomonas musculus]|uniref:Caspase family p20 domain-containing protein n=1 Tax=Tritrichomonas musculus TaxID=1915356 RepID=A0ABR2IJY3_9EUKA